MNTVVPFRRTGLSSHQSARSQTVEWLTPQYVLDQLGEFDLDPCAASAPRPWSTAKEHIAPPDDGLKAVWHGRVWLNPPYGREVKAWVHKLVRHGRGTMLVPARTETDWFRLVPNFADGVLFLHGRLYFHRPDGSRGHTNAGAPSCLVAFGYDDAYRLKYSTLPGWFVPVRGFG